MVKEQGGEWAEYRKLILAELTRLSDGIVALNAKFDNLHSSEIAAMKAQIAVLQVKSGVWGFIAGAVSGAIPMIYNIMAGHK